MKKMTPDEVYAFLNDHPLTAHVATVREDGRPHVAPVWIAVDGEDIVFTTWHTTVKGKNIQRAGYAAISVDDSIPPFSSARAEGPIEIIDDLGELRHWATVIGGRYMGADRADEYGARNAVEGELLCRMHPMQVSGIIGIAD
jgi:PPOX class probable F420-dependent enzyme